MPANRAAASGLGQANDAAERSAHVARAAAGCEGVIPCVEVSPGVWKLRVLVEAEVENARLRAEVVALRADLAMARAREGATGLEYRGG